MINNTKYLPFPPTPTAPAHRLPEIVTALFHHIGEDGNREGLKRTPERFAKALLEMTRGYAMNAADVIGEGIFESESNGPIAVNGIEFFSLCEHHILPFWGTVSIAYLPKDKILGLSKLARVVDVFSKRLQVQERLTAQIGENLRDFVDARAVVVTVEAQHMCMMMRGVGKIGSSTKTEFLWRDESVGSEEMNRLISQIAPIHKGVQ